MKEIGVIICNYNKRNYVLDCIDSVLESTIDNFDIYVVDNASNDNSVEAIKKKYDNKIYLISNEENVGGSGGFNIGIREALNRNYKYLMCVDNDIIMENDNIEKLYCFMEENQDVGMVGSKICRMNQRDRLQEMGADINFETCMVEPHFKNYLDTIDLPAIQYCDYVPACSLLIRASVVNKVGMMPEENFIYWDDMDWGYRVKNAGYKIAALREAKVYHAMGTNSGHTYFSTYYFWRNRINFFLTYAKNSNREHVIEVLSESLFQTLYGCFYKGKVNQIKTMLNAFDDAVHHNLGKAKDSKILQKDNIEDRIQKYLEQKDNILIEFNGDYKLLQQLSLKSDCFKKITIFYDKKEELLIQHPYCKVIDKIEDTMGFDNYLVMCNHIVNLKNPKIGKVYVDGYSNILENESDRQHFMNYDYCSGFFIYIFKSLISKGWYRDND